MAGIPSSDAPASSPTPASPAPPGSAAASAASGGGPRADLLTLAAVTAVVYASGALIHEILGHGGACVATGGSTISWSSVHFECTVESNTVTAAGTVLNVLAGAILFLAWRASAGAAAATRYALWLATTINWMQAAGYFLFSGALGIGDWAAVLRRLGWGGPARAAMAIAGGLVYLLVVRFAARELRAFLPGRRESAEPAARRLTLFPWIVGGLLSCVAGALNPVGYFLVAISAAAASFGGTSGLAWMASLAGSGWAPLDPRAGGLAIPRHRGWIAAGIVSTLLFVAVMGPGSGAP